MKVAFLGLGVMGFPMARHLAAGGHEVAVYNRTRARAEQWAGSTRGRVAAAPADAARDAALVFTCVGRDEDVRDVVLGPDGALGAMSAGAALVDHTTTSAALAREVAAAATARGVGFLDAPVSGGQQGAEKGILTVMAGGEAATFATAEPVVACYARTFRLLGPAGAGQLTKMVNQICIAGLLQGLAEGVDFALRAGLDADRVLDVIGKGAAQSWQMDNRGKTMAADKFDFGFAVDWMRKDLGICLGEARANGASLPVTAIVDQFYARVQQMGGGRWDTSSLIRLLRQAS